MTTPLDSRQLRAFSVLARTGSFTLAARELHLSQSAVSHAMKGLEEDVGCRLLDRMGKKVLLTQAGEQFLQHAEKILIGMQQARDSLQHLGKWGGGRLRIGASGTACQHILPPALREFKKNFPQWLVSIQPSDTPQALQQLSDNLIDFALILEPGVREHIEFLPLFTDELFFIVSPAHPWARQGAPQRDDIPRQSYILYSRNSYTFRLVEEFFAVEDMTLNTVIEVGSMEATKEFVKLGLGISILAPWIAQKELLEKSLVAVPLGRRKLKRTWGIAYRKGRRLNLGEETFVQNCRSTTENQIPAA